MSFTPAYPHGAIETLADDVFMVRGSMRMNPVMRITRNMAIVRDGDALTLVNPIRLDERTLGALDELGRVRHLLRLGPFHGTDDPFYMDRYAPEFWCQPGGQAYTEPAIDHPLSEGGELPFSNASLFAFRGTLQPEAALLLEVQDGLLLTCDAIQHYGDYSYNNLPARLLMPFIGFPRTTLVGPIWLKLMTPEGMSLRDEFERLAGLGFNALLSAHGTFLADGAREAVSAAVARAFA